MSESENFILPANNTLNQTYGQKNQRPVVNIIHKSEIMQSLLKMVDRVAQSSGGGQKLIIRESIDKGGSRPQQPGIRPRVNIPKFPFRPPHAVDAREIEIIVDVRIERRKRKSVV